MIGLAAIIDFTVLDFDKIAHMYLVMQYRTGTQACIRTNAAVSPDNTAVDMAKGGQLCSIGDRGIPDNTVRTDFHIITKCDFTFKNAADVNFHIAPAIEMTSHINPGGVGQRNTLH